MSVEFLKEHKKHIAKQMGFIGFRSHVYIIIGAETVRKYKLSEKRWFFLGYDKENKVVVIKYLEEGSTGALRASFHRGQLVISATNFFSHFDLPIMTCKFFRIKKENNTLQISLNED